MQELRKPDNGVERCPEFMDILARKSDFA